MKVTPHLVAETMLEYRASDMWRSKRGASHVLALVRQATLFDFKDLHPSNEHKDFALDLYERQLFGLPFPVTAFAFEGVPNPSQYIGSQRAAGAMMVLSQDDDRRITAIMCSEMRDPDGRSLGAIPFAIVLRAKMSDARDSSVKIEEETYPIVDDRMMAAMYGSADARGHDTMRNRLCSNLVACMGMTVMLMSKGVETEHHAAPAKLNKAREKRGKPRIGDSYTVRIKAGSLYAIADEAGEQDISGHVRGSPRLHWRRGHFRTLHRSSERERVVPVAPSLVGANETAEPIRKSYAVKA